MFVLVQSRYELAFNSKLLRLIFRYANDGELYSILLLFQFIVLSLCISVLYSISQFYSHLIVSFIYFSLFIQKYSGSEYSFQLWKFYHCFRYTDILHKYAEWSIIKPHSTKKHSFGRKWFGESLHQHLIERYFFFNSLSHILFRLIVYNLKIERHTGEYIQDNIEITKKLLIFPTRNNERNLGNYLASMHYALLICTYIRCINQLSEPIN